MSNGYLNADGTPVLQRPIAVNQVYCADWKEVLKAIGSQSVDLILTDMPYG